MNICQQQTNEDIPENMDISNERLMKYKNWLGNKSDTVCR